MFLVPAQTIQRFSHQHIETPLDSRLLHLQKPRAQMGRAADGLVREHFHDVPTQALGQITARPDLILDRRRRLQLRRVARVDRDASQFPGILHFSHLSLSNSRRASVRASNRTSWTSAGCAGGCSTSSLFFRGGFDRSWHRTAEFGVGPQMKHPGGNTRGSPDAKNFITPCYCFGVSSLALEHSR